jgi:hypothetical protein
MWVAGSGDGRTSLRVLLAPCAHAYASKRNDEQLVPVDPLGYVAPLGKVLSYAHKLFQVSDTGLVHNPRSGDMYPELPSCIRNGRLQNEQRFLWHRSDCFAHPNNFRQKLLERMALLKPEEPAPP